MYSSDKKWELDVDNRVCVDKSRNKLSACSEEGIYNEEDEEDDEDDEVEEEEEEAS